VRPRDKETKKDRKKPYAQWQTGYSPRPPTSSDRNEILRGGWSSGVVLRLKFHQHQLNGFGAVGGRNLPIPIDLDLLCTSLDHASVQAVTILVEKAASPVIALQVLYVVVVCITDIIKESLCAYFADDMPHFKTVVVFDCRGVEPTDFEPRVCSFSVLYIINKSSPQQ